MSIFKLKTEMRPAGDQPQAIDKLTEGVRRGLRHQTLLGVTGSGKTFTVANVIANTLKPTLVIAHNKTLAAQLCNEFRELFPDNAVHYFVSYYDYYQPEAYMPASDTYIEKEAMINEEIDKLRHAATMSLLTRQDVIIVASVSCIYGLGAPEAYERNIVRLKVGDAMVRKDFTKKLVGLQFTRTTASLTRSTFRLRGENWEIMPADREVVYNIEVQDGIVRRIEESDSLRTTVTEQQEIMFAPAKHFITEADDRSRAIADIQKELDERLKYFEKNKMFLEAERLERRTKNDIAMMREIGYCHGIENYSRHLSGRPAGAAPDTLLSYFPKIGSESPTQGRSLSSSFLTIIDESHITVPQISGMYNGDQARKKTLIEYGFRLPSAADNRPLKFDEFNERVGQIIYTTATPGPYELKMSDPSTSSGQVVEQVIRPTGLIDPEIILKPAKGQVQDLIEVIKQTTVKGERVLVTTLTKKMAEDLTEYLNKDLEAKSYKLKAIYLHSDVKTMDRIRTLSDFRKGKYDVLVGVNLLREGLDLPEVSLVAILDADKEGFLRSETSLIQTIGRAARNVEGKVILYADNITGSIKRAVGETERRRKLQIAYNKEHGITPTTIKKAIKDILPTFAKASAGAALNLELSASGGKALEKLIKEKEKEMKQAAHDLDFELAAILRDEVKLLIKEQKKEGK